MVPERLLRLLGLLSRPTLLGLEALLLLGAGRFEELS